MKIAKIGKDKKQFNLTCCQKIEKTFYTEPYNTICKEMIFPYSSSMHLRAVTIKIR